MMQWELREVRGLRKSDREVKIMNRTEKEALVKDLKQKISGAKALFLTNLVGLPSNRANEIRKSIRSVKGSIVVTRNTLFERAAKGTDAQDILVGLKGVNALALAFGDAPAVAKVLYEAGKENEVVTLERGGMDGQLLTKNQLVHLAKLPSREVILCTLLATMQAPVASFVRVLDAIREQKEQNQGGTEGPTERTTEEVTEQ